MDNFFNKKRSSVFEIDLRCDKITVRGALDRCPRGISPVEIEAEYLSRHTGR